MPTPQPPTAAPIPEIKLSDNPPYVAGGGAIPVGAFARIGIGTIEAAVAIPQKNTLLAISGIGLSAYDLDTLQPIWRNYLEKDFNSYSISPDGNQIITEYEFRSNPILWSTSTGKRVADIPGWYSAYWSPDSTRFAVEADPGRDFDALQRMTVDFINIYDGDTGALIQRLEAPMNGFYAHFLNMGSWSPDSRYLAACVYGTLYIWDTANGERLSFTGKNGALTDIELPSCQVIYDPTGKYLAAQSRNVIYVYDASSGMEVYRLLDTPAHKLMWFRNLIFAPSWDLAIVNGSGPLTVIDNATWKTVANDALTHISDWDFSPATNQLGVANGSVVTVLDMSNFSTQYTIADPGGVYWSPGGRWLVTYSRVDNGRTLQRRFYDARTGVRADITVTSERASFIDDSRILAQDDSKLMYFDLDQGQILSAMRTGVNVIDLSWADDNQTLMISGSDGTWYWSEGAGLSQTFEGAAQFGTPFHIDQSDKRVFSYEAKSPDGTITAKSANDGVCGDGPFGPGCGNIGATLDLYLEKNDTSYVSLTNDHTGITSLAWSPDGSLLAIGYSEDIELNGGYIDIIDPRTGNVLMTFQGHLGDVEGLAFSPDNSLLASASTDGSIVIWNLGG